MFLFKKRGNRFENYSSKIKNYIEKGDYDSALARYSKLRNIYKMLPSEKKLEYKQEYESLVNQLRIYMKFEELKVIINGDNLSLIRDTLSDLDYLINTNFNIPKSYLDYIHSNYEDYMNQYSIKLSVNELNESIREVTNLRDDGFYDTALEKFPDVMEKFRELTSYTVDTNHIYKKLISLREELKSKLLKSEAYGKVGKINFKTLKKSLKR